MTTYLLMGLLVIGIALSTLWGVRYDSSKNSFMSKDDSTFLRGFWCIIVVLVHVPETYQNPIQDMLGSFAYIGVTFFFMTSAYGLKWSVEHKPGYLDHFWRRRLSNILIPALIANAYEVLMKSLNGTDITVLSFLNINGWVKVLLLYYLVFWIVYKLVPDQIKGVYIRDLIICLIVIIFSLVDYFTHFRITSIWIVEPLGFAYGIIVANHYVRIQRWIETDWIKKCIALMVTSGILGIAYLIDKSIAFWGDYLLKITLGITITAFIFALISKLKVGNKTNSFLGSVSYEVYILHRGVFVFVTVIFGQSINSGIYILCAMFITVILAFILKIICQPILGCISKIGG